MHLEEQCIVEFENIFRKSMKMFSSDQMGEIIHGRRIIYDTVEHMVIHDSRDRIFDKATPRVVQPNEKLTCISAIDSSAIHLAGTDEGGAVYAAKSGIVIASGKKIRQHFRIGPMFIHINKEFLCNSKIDHNLVGLLLIDSSIAKRLIRIRLERAIQLVLSSRLDNSIVLIDGALKPSVFEDYNCSISKVIEMSSLSSNDVIGLSKNTSMSSLNQYEKSLKALPYSAYIDMSCIIKSQARNTLGNNLLVKLGKSENGYILRADVCSANGNDEECVGKLIGNDILFRCYPESLRIAHHISTFTATEVSSLRGFMSRTNWVEEIDQYAKRKNLLGASPI
ncbi:MAG TPA: DNA double-strand break repair nuclease NurA [Nitrososphaeraceae archaeon]|nr:DNA double-strand break repair nuclease NurA [Nitrososphaeraceae archaeon]